MFSRCNDCEDCNRTHCETFSCVRQLTSLVVLVCEVEDIVIAIHIARVSFLSAYSRLGVATADICIFIT